MNQSRSSSLHAARLLRHTLFSLERYAPFPSSLPLFVLRSRDRDAEWPVPPRECTFSDSQCCCSSPSPPHALTPLASLPTQPSASCHALPRPPGSTHPD